MSYEEYLDSEEWQTKRRLRLQMDGYRCQMCGSAINLQVHHITYEHLHEDAEIDDLVTVCKTCHQQLHAVDLEMRGNSLFRLALSLLNKYSQDKERAWDKYNEACRQYEQQPNPKECAAIWLKARDIAVNW